MDSSLTLAFFAIWPPFFPAIAFSSIPVYLVSTIWCESRRAQRWALRSCGRAGFLFRPLIFCADYHLYQEWMMLVRWRILLWWSVGFSNGDLFSFLTHHPLLDPLLTLPSFCQLVRPRLIDFWIGDLLDTFVTYLASQSLIGSALGLGTDWMSRKIVWVSATSVRRSFCPQRTFSTGDNLSPFDFLFIQTFF